jgi:ATP-dependent DNA ligase
MENSLRSTSIAKPISICSRTSVQPIRQITFYAFGVLVRCGEDLTKHTFSKRREILASTITRVA